MEKKTTGAREFVASIEAEFRRFQAAGEAAMAQLSDNELLSAPEGSNSVAVIVRHLSGNFLSRFTDFLTTDGEKPWRDRDSEFEDRTYTRAEIMERWDKGWSVLNATLSQLTETDLSRHVTIRGETLTVHAAPVRSVACRAVLRRSPSTSTSSRVESSPRRRGRRPKGPLPTGVRVARFARASPVDVVLP